MNQEVFNRLHTMLTTHVNCKEVRTLANKNRYVFERIGETAIIQLPKNEEAKFVYTYSDEEERDMPFWLQHIVQQCEVHFQETKESTEEKEEPISNTTHRGFEREEDWVDLPVILKGTIETEEQHLLVKKLIRSGFKVFPDED